MFLLGGFAFVILFDSFFWVLCFITCVCCVGCLRLRNTYLFRVFYVWALLFLIWHLFCCGNAFAKCYFNGLLVLFVWFGLVVGLLCSGAFIMWRLLWGECGLFDLGDDDFEIFV